jgi:hypothetical protein
VAAEIRREIGAETRLVEGSPGELSVWVGDVKVAEKGWLFFPSPRKVVATLREMAGR